MTDERDTTRPISLNCRHCGPPVKHVATKSAPGNTCLYCIPQRTHQYILRFSVAVSEKRTVRGLPQLGQPGRAAGLGIMHQLRRAAMGAARHLRQVQQPSSRYVACALGAATANVPDAVC